MQRFLPTQTWKNNEYVQPFVRKEDDVSDDEYALVAEAQTSGGLLAAVRPDQVPDVLAALHDAGDARAAVVGEVEPLVVEGDGRKVYLRVTKS